MTTIYRIRWTTSNKLGVVETGLGDGYGTREQAEAVCKGAQEWWNLQMAYNHRYYTMTYTVEAQEEA